MLERGAPRRRGRIRDQVDPDLARAARRGRRPATGGQPAQPRAASSRSPPRAACRTRCVVRVFTSHTTRTSPSRSTRSISPPSQRQLRSSRTIPCAGRCRAASASPYRPSACLSQVARSASIHGGHLLAGSLAARAPRLDRRRPRTCGFRALPAALVDVFRLISPFRERRGRRPSVTVRAGDVYGKGPHDVAGCAQPRRARVRWRSRPPSSRRSSSCSCSGSSRCRCCMRDTVATTSAVRVGGRVASVVRRSRPGRLPGQRQPAAVRPGQHAGAGAGRRRRDPAGRQRDAQGPDRVHPRLQGERRRLPAADRQHRADLQHATACGSSGTRAEQVPVRRRHLGLHHDQRLRQPRQPRHRRASPWWPSTPGSPGCSATASTIAERSVMNFEPLPSEQCMPGTHL